ncbi:MAG: sulfotransferase [Saprospiraceae bacterium]
MQSPDISPHRPILPIIYILGNSHSGSTLFALLMSAHPDIINLGEFKAPTWTRDRKCTCGREIPECPFYHDFFARYNEVRKRIFESIKPGSSLELVFKSAKKNNLESIKELSTFYTELSQRVFDHYPLARYITDSSKSLWMLNAWLQALPQEDVKIIWIRRHLKPNVASFVKRGHSFLSSLVALITNEKLNRKYLLSNKLPFVEVDYSRFYDDYDAELKNVSDFIGLSVPTQYTDHRNHHVISGNRQTLNQFTTNFHGLQKDDQWESILSKTQKRILSWLEK